MHFYTYGVLWYTLLDRLGIQVVLSDLTGQKELDTGTKKMVDSACLPVKIMRGHVENLKEKGVDYIFMPRVVQPAKGVYTCPKSAGLPELMFQTGRDLPRMLCPAIEGSIADPGPYYETGRMLGRTARETKKAFLTALRRWERWQQRSESGQEGDEVLLLLGHPYLTEDRFLNRNLKAILREKGYRVVTASGMKPQAAPDGFYPKTMFWQSGCDMAALLTEEAVKQAVGAVLLTAFGCGPDSYTETYCRQYLDRIHVPHLTLTLDEQTGEAGLLTRVEAFLDVLQRRGRRQGA